MEVQRHGIVRSLEANAEWRDTRFCLGRDSQDYFLTFSGSDINRGNGLNGNLRWQNNGNPLRAFRVIRNYGTSLTRAVRL